MPRLNSVGSAVMGIGGISLSIDGTIPPIFVGVQSGGWDWFSDTVLFGQADTGSGFKCYTYTPIGAVLTQVNPAGANLAFAGGGIWARFLVGSGVLTSLGSLFPLAALADVSPTGETVIVQDYQAGRGLQVYSAAGALVLTLDTQLDPAANVALRAGILTYKDGSGWHLVNVSTGQPIGFTARTESINWMVPVTLTGGKIALLERSERLTIRYKDAVLGYVVQGTPNTFNPDVIEQSAGIARIAWSTTSGEGSTDLTEIDITLTNGANSRGVVTGGAAVFSTRPALPTSSLPGTPVGPAGEDSTTGPLGAFLDGLYRQQVVETSRIITRPWYAFFIALIQQVVQPVNLANAGGVLGPTQGGTGVTTGLTQLNALNLTAGNIPIARFNNGLNASAATFFRGDGPFGSWQPASGAGVGDVIGPASSVDGQVALFDGLTGKLLKAATQTGVAYMGSGVLTTCDLSVVTNGSPTVPEVVFDSNGDVVMSLVIH